MEYDLEKSSLQSKSHDTLNHCVCIFMFLMFLILVKVKELEQELKTVKKSYDVKMKKMEKKISENNNGSILSKL